MPKKQLLAGKKNCRSSRNGIHSRRNKKVPILFGNLGAEVELQTYLWGDN